MPTMAIGSSGPLPPVDGAAARSPGEQLIGVSIHSPCSRMRINGVGGPLDIGLSLILPNPPAWGNLPDRPSPRSTVPELVLAPAPGIGNLRHVRGSPVRLP